MGDLKPLEEMAGDVHQGDFVSVHLHFSQYRGFVWWTPAEEGTLQGPTSEEWIEDNKKRFLAEIADGLLDPRDTDIILCPLQPLGTTMYEGWSREDRYDFHARVQFVGISIDKACMGNERILGYEVLERVPEEARKS
jgi:hypothetical protein